MTKLDANSGYWQMPLDEPSQLLCTFITPCGRYCPTRGPFGLSSMSEIFSKRLDQMIEGLVGVAKSMDDFLIYGKNTEEHDERMNKFLVRMSEEGVTFNLEKCKFNQREVEFLGHKISASGIQPLESRIDAIAKFSTPQNIYNRITSISRYGPTTVKIQRPIGRRLTTA